MIKSVRPLFSLLLLIAIGTALSCRAAVRRRSFNLSMQEEAPLSVVVESQEAVVFNTTLLKLAAIDLGEEKSREEIHQLLQGDFLNKAPYRTISSWRRYHNRLGNDNVERRARSSFSSSKLPIQLRSPKYNGLWPQFRRSLRNWFRNKRFQPQIMSELIHLIKIPIDQHQGFLPTSPPTKYASCAVVGNSGILLKGEHGALIDSHEMVIRLNNARTRGFEHHVGSKTGMSFVNSNILHLCSHRESCFCHPYGETVPIVMYVCQPVHFMDYALCNASHKAPLLITDARFDVLCTRIVKYYSLKHFLEETGKSPQEWAPAHDGAMFHYSSGMQAVMLALGLCERVSVFGFGKSSMAKHHYHTNQKAELQLHDYEAEYVFYHDLVEKPQWFGFCCSGGLDSATSISGGSRPRLSGFYVSSGLSQFPVVTFLLDFSVSGDSSSLPDFYFWDSTSGFYVSLGLSQLPVVTFLPDFSISGFPDFLGFRWITFVHIRICSGFSALCFWVLSRFALDFWALSFRVCFRICSGFLGSRFTALPDFTLL